MTLRYLLSGSLAAVLVCNFARAEGANDARTKQSTSKDAATSDGKTENPKTAAQRKVAETLKLLLEKYDKDKDGKLNDEERKAIRDDRAKERSQTTPRKRPSKRKTVRPNPRARQVLAKYDKNKNGKLDGAELRSYQRDFAKYRQKAMKKLQQMMRGGGKRRGGSNRSRGRRGGSSRNNSLRRLQELRKRQLQQRKRRRR